MPNYWNQPLSSLYQKLDTNIEGLSTTKARELQYLYGANTLSTQNNSNIIKIVFSQINNPLIIVLIIVGIISFFLGDKVNGGVILAMIGINALVGFVQEYRAHKSVANLKKLIFIEAKVVRDGKLIHLHSQELVPGDIIELNRGDIIPADVRLISTKQFVVDESVLTGESESVLKSENRTSNSTQPQDVLNGAFHGSAVISGSAKCIVVATGNQTYMGRNLKLAHESEVKTKFMKDLEKFTNTLFYLVAVITGAVFLINIYLHRGIFDSFILGVTLALGITPEVMPIILTISLSNAAHKLSAKNVLVKRLTALEDLGNIDTLCSDKTGTITTGQLTLNSYFDRNGKSSKTLLLVSMLCNAENEMIGGHILHNSIDDTIWGYHKSKSLYKEVEQYEIIEAWDFDFSSRLMGVIAKKANESMIIIKGSYESVLANSKSFIGKKALLRKINEFEMKGFRVIAVAQKSLVRTVGVKSPTSIKNYEFAGFFVLSDTPRLGMKSDFEALSRLNIDLKIITGDSPEVTRNICTQVGLVIKDDHIYTGDELESLLRSGVQSKYIEAVIQHNVFARVSPEQKYQIVKTLSENNHVVGYLGDGVNDASALKAADVGIAVDNATDIAKDSADVIILDKKLDSVITGIMEGRKVFGNSIKFIFSTMSSSFGNVITVAVASAFFKFLPLLPIQILLIDTLSDFQHLTISTDNVDKNLITRPSSWDITKFIKITIYWGLVSTISDFILIGFINKMTTSPVLFRTTWMVESVITEILATFSIRTTKPFYKSRPSTLLMFGSALVIAIVIYLPFSKWGDLFFGLAPLPLKLLLFIALVVSIYFVVLEVLKKRFYKGYLSN